MPPFEGPSAATFLGTLGELSGVDLALTIVFWRCELSCLLAQWKALDEHIEFICHQYASILGHIVAPSSSSDGPWVKHMWTGASVKGKERAVEGVEVINLDSPEAGRGSNDGSEWGSLGTMFDDV